VPNEKINWVAVQNRESPYAVTLVDKKADLVPIDEDTASPVGTNLFTSVSEELTSVSGKSTFVSGEFTSILGEFTLRSSQPKSLFHHNSLRSHFWHGVTPCSTPPFHDVAPFMMWHGSMFHV
jgi:hypothetical protein